MEYSLPDADYDDEEDDDDGGDGNVPGGRDYGSDLSAAGWAHPVIREPDNGSEDGRHYESLPMSSLRDVKPGFEAAPQMAPTQHALGLGASGPVDDSAIPSEIMLNLPSRTVGRKSGKILGSIRRRNTSIRRTSSIATSTSTPDDETELLLQELVALSAGDRQRTLREMLTPLAEKRSLQSRAARADQDPRRTRRAAGAGCCTSCLLTVKITLRRCGDSLRAAGEWLSPWRSALKSVGSRFGTGVLSYFLFLRWLLWFDLLAVLLTVGFMLIPQSLEVTDSNSTGGTPFRGLEILTGAGAFSDSLLYYGYYSNSTLLLRDGRDSPYNMQLSYFFTTAAYIIACAAGLLYSMGSSFSQNYVVPGQGTDYSKAFCSWDFRLTNEKAVTLKQRNLSMQLKELLAELRADDEALSLPQRLRKLLVHVGVWLATTAASAGSCAGIYFLSKNNKHNQDGNLADEAALLLLPFVVCLLNLVLPLLYSLLGLVEVYRHPRHRIFANILRNVILKMSLLGILCYYWIDIVPESNLTCWETFVGQDLYRLIVMDFIFSLLETFFGEFIWGLGARCCYKGEDGSHKPEFDIARNVLNLINAQTLLWLGLFFSPLLPFIQIIKLVIIFYVKKLSLRMNCQPPRRAWRAAQTSTFFIFLQFFPAFVGYVSLVVVLMWRKTPSANCGPFRSLPLFYDAVRRWVTEVDKTRSAAVWLYINFMESALFFFIISAFLLMAVYIQYQLYDGRKQTVKLLQQQIKNEGHDKQFLLERLQNEHKKKQQQGNRQGRAGGAGNTKPSGGQPMGPSAQFPEKTTTEGRVSFPGVDYSLGPDY